MIELLKTFVQTAFRFIGFPTQTGLRTFGNPGSNAPVFLTGNFDLTVRRVSRALRDLDCYLLVASSKGINVWCAAAGGILNEHAVISVLKTSGVGERVRHRTLILPQFAAPGVDIERVREETGWHCKFGPAYAKDIPAYVDRRFTKTTDMSLARFPLSDRLEMAVMWGVPFSLIVGAVLFFVNRQAMPGALALVWFMSLGFFVLFHQVVRYVPGPTGLHKSVLIGILVGAVLAAYGGLVAGWSTGATIGWGVWPVALGILLGFDLEGESPLYAGSTVTYWGVRWPWVLTVWEKMGFAMESAFTVHVDGAKCLGDGQCTQVCPKGVYALFPRAGSKKKVSRIVDLDACEMCTACVKQCPGGAIWTST
jgi:NAD-dependent dihydropyrimidine dehydrogenase PreA subunit